MKESIARTNSPFNIYFGQKPLNTIDRNDDFNQVASVFDSDTPETKIILLTGARGVGKTVLLTSLKSYYDDKNNWITADINPNSDIFEQLASKIYESGKLKKLFLKKEFNFSFAGFSMTIAGEKPVSSINVLLEKMFEYLAQKKIRILITIDEIVSNDNLKIFVHSFQSWIRENYPVFLLATGLYENIEKISTDKNLTFLARSPKIYLSSLNMRAITFSYMDIFNISEKEAVEISKLTSGYAYAFQLLGSILYKSGKKVPDKDVMEKYDLLLDENAYSYIWRGLSENEKKILFAISSTDGVIKNIISASGLTNSALQVYKSILVKKGIVSDFVRGKLLFVLPRFREFVAFQANFI